MVRDLTPRPPRWLQRASGLVLIAAGCAQLSVTALAAPQIPSGAARIWFYQGYESPVGYSPASTPTIFANGSYVGTPPPGSVFYRDVPPGHYDITIPNRFDFKYQSAHFDLAAGQQAYVKIILNRESINGIRWPPSSGFGALLVPEQVAEAEVPSLAAGSAQQ
jgi:hypothetical protein